MCVATVPCVACRSLLSSIAKSLSHAKTCGARWPHHLFLQLDPCQSFQPRRRLFLSHFEAKVNSVDRLYREIPGVVAAMATPRTSERAKTPSRRIFEASQPVDTPRTKKRKRLPAGIVEISDVEEEDEDVEEVYEGLEASEGSQGEVEPKVTEEKRLAGLDYESIWRLVDEKNKELSKKVYLLTGSDETFAKAHTWAVKYSPSIDHYVRRFRCRIFSKAMAQRTPGSLISTATMNGG